MRKMYDTIHMGIINQYVYQHNTINEMIKINIYAYIAKILVQVLFIIPRYNLFH